MKRYLFVIAAFLALFAFTTSCDGEQVSSQIVEYSTPTIKGTISIPTGSNISPENIYIKVVDPSNNTVTVKKVNSDSSFVIESLKAETKYKLLFTSQEPDSTNRDLKGDDEHHGVGCWMHDVVPEEKEGKDIGRIKLKILGSIKGKATVDGAEEHYDTTVYIPGTSFAAITEKDGSFIINNVPDGTYTLRYTHDGCVAIMKEEVVLVCPDGEKNPQKIVEDVTLISNKGTVEGKVILGDKTDFSGVIIKLESEDKSLSYTGSTSNEGTYTITGVIPGKYRVIASYSMYLSEMTDYFNVEAATVTPVPAIIELLGEYGVVSGTASLADTENKEGIQILLKNTSNTDSYTIITDVDGLFTKKVKPGEYSVTAYKTGYSSITLDDITVNAGESVSLSIPSLLSTSASVTGFVTLEGGADNGGVIITITNTVDKTVVYHNISASDGSFRITGITKGGTYLLTYSKDGYVSNLSNSVDVTVGRVSTVSPITLKSIMATVSGKIQLEGASTHEGITILLKNSTNQYTASTDQKGEYKINRVLPGTYTLMASKDGYVTASTNEFVIEASSDKRVDLLNLGVAVRSVVGKVSLELGSDYAGALVTATNTSDTSIVYSAISNSAGDYTLAGMKPGEYLIVISKSGYATATLPTVNIVADTLTNVGSVNLSVLKGEITGIARLEGCSNHSGIKVSILGTDWISETKEDGTYSFTVPAGNYSGGIRYEYDDFETTSYATNIAVLPTTSYSDAYVVPDIEMKCLRVPKISGKVTIYGLTKAQYQDITITIAELPKFTYTTGEDGTYYFEHVPVGTYTFEFTRENARKVTKIVAVEAAPEIRIENIELIPDAVTLYGNISLTGVADYSGVTVRITTPDSVELKTVTNAAGYWYISNIVASKSHTITFEKTGWDSRSFDIVADAYEPLSETNYNTEHPVALFDTVAPVISALTATVGKSTEAGREIYLYLYTQEEGSGVKYIQGNTSGSFDGVTEQEYYNPFKLIIPDELGDKTIYVRIKDAAGNTSNTLRTNVVLKNDKTELYQTLSGDKLHLKATDDNGEHIVYLMTDNILVPSGETLVIDPGVEIQINGAYYIQVEGTLSAIGTADDRIKIYGIDDGSDKWLGFKILNDNGSKIAYADISGLYAGIQGYCDIDNSIITAADYGYALGYSMMYGGTITNSNIAGKINASLTDVLNNTISSNSIGLTVSGSVFNNEFNVKSSGSIIGSSLIQNTFSGTGTLYLYNVYMMNNKVDVSNVAVTDSIVKYTTFNNSALDIIGGAWSYNTLNNCTFSIYSVYRFTDSNFNGCGIITITSKRLTQETFNMKNNYWGAVNTVELDQKSATDQVSFIYHYANDFNLTRVDWSDYVKTALTDCGYQGKGFRTTGSYSGYKIGDRGPAGGIVFYDKGYYSDGWRYLEAATADLGQYVFGYYRPSEGEPHSVGTSNAIGSGKDNTENLVETMDIEGMAYCDYESYDTRKAEYAARKCYDYESGGYSDWFLPSKEELNLMYTNLHKAELGSFTTSWYWSSSENTGDRAWNQSFYSGKQDNNTSGYRYYDYYVRPARGF